MRLIKGLLWYFAFSALCIAATLTAMRQIAVRSGSEGLYEAWLDEIGDAFDEAGVFIGDCYEKAEKVAHGSGGPGRQAGTVKPDGGGK
jgi:hypothetical protein